MLELKNITFKIDNKLILDNVSLNIDNNEFVVITGPNGSGKSTLAKIIMGICKPTSGQVLFNGKDITKMSITDRSKLGLSFAFQQPIKFKGVTVYDLLRISTGKDIDKHEACNLLSVVGLCALNYVDREIDDSLSGGEIKRIEIASIISRESLLSIFDEPEAGIDLWSFNNLINLFKKLNKEKKRTTIIISHQEKILDIADRIIVLMDGKITSTGTSSNIIKNTTSCCKLGGNNHE